jgi:hypothetical protein
VIPHKLNGRLLFLALLGVILYFTSTFIMSLSKNDSMEEDLGPPAVSSAAAQETALQFAAERLGFQAVETDTAYQSEKYTSGYVTKNGLKAAYTEKYDNKAPLDYWLIIARDAEDRVLHIRVGMEKPIVTSWEENGALSRTHDEKSVTTAMKALKDNGWNPDDFTHTPSTAKADANRFTFLSKKETIGEAPMAITIGIANGKAVSFETGFQIPDTYMDWIKHQERLAAWMTGAFFLFTAGLGITAIVLSIVHGRKVTWSRGIFLTLVFLGLYLIQNWNVTEALMAVSGGGDSDTEAFATVFMMVFIALSALLMAAAVWFSLLSGDQQWRMKGWHPWPRWRDPEFGHDIFYGMGRGYLICFFILGIQQAVFLAEANIFDSFGIADPTQSPLNMKWPYLFPAAAWVAAIMEEAIYRMFGVILFKRILRNNFLALLVSSVIWALGHTGYTLYPSYTRLVEVTVLGFVFGYTFLRYGFMTAVFAHAIMDSLLMAVYVMTDEPSTFNILIGTFYIILPALIGYVVRFLHPRFGGPRRKLYEPHHPPGQPDPGPEPRLVP